MTRTCWFGGLLPLLRLAESVGPARPVTEHLTVDSLWPVAKTGSVLAGMLTGTDRIDDLNVRRHGAMPTLFGGGRRPRRWSYLLSFTHGQVQRLDRRPPGC
jgi:hypothetical protein